MSRKSEFGRLVKEMNFLSAHQSSSLTVLAAIAPPYVGRERPRGLTERSSNPRMRATSGSPSEDAHERGPETLHSLGPSSQRNFATDTPRVDVAQIGCCRAETGANIARPERNSIWIVILPADGTALPNGGNGDFGTSPIYGQLSDKHCLPQPIWGAER